MNISDRLRRARENKNITQTKVSKVLGISNKTLSGYERGVSEPDLKTIVLLANFYGVSVDYLVGNSSIYYRDVSKLRMVRVESGLSQEEVARNLGISKDTLSKYETGELEPNIDTLIRIASIYNVSLDSIVGKTNAKVECENENVSEFEKRFNKLGPEEQKDLEKYMKLLEIKTKMDSNDKKTNYSTLDK